jgi:hypothetical protein
VSLLNFARLFHQKQIILKLIFLLGISRQKHLPQQRLQLQHPLQKKFDKNFTNDTFLIHPTKIPFLTAMEANDTRLNIQLSISKEDIVENLLSETADPITFDPGHWQRNNNMGINFTPRNPHSIITEGGKEYIKVQPFIAPIDHNTLTSARQYKLCIH